MGEIIIHYPSDAIIFDMDGVLIDSEPLWQLAREEFLSRHNKAEVASEIQETAVGMGMRDEVILLQTKYAINGETGQLMREYRELFYTLALENKKLQWMAGVNELVKTLSSLKPIAIATGGHTRDMVIKMLNLVSIASYFTVIVSSDDVSKGKPAPDVYLETARKLGVSQKRCIVVEDAVNGVIAAKRAGMIVFGVNKDNALRKKLTNAGAQKVFKSLDRIRKEYFE